MIYCVSSSLYTLCPYQVHSGKRKGNSACLYTTSSIVSSSIVNASVTSWSMISTLWHTISWPWITNHSYLTPPCLSASHALPPSGFSLYCLHVHGVHSHCYLHAVPITWTLQCPTPPPPCHKISLLLILTSNIDNHQWMYQPLSLCRDILCIILYAWLCK